MVATGIPYLLKLERNLFSCPGGGSFFGEQMIELVKFFGSLIVGACTVCYTVPKTAKILRDKKSVEDIDEEVKKYIEKTDSNGVEIIKLKGANKVFAQKQADLEKRFEKHEKETEENFNKLDNRITTSNKDIKLEIKEKFNNFGDRLAVKFNEILQAIEKKS